MALSGHAAHSAPCPLSGVTRTSFRLTPRLEAGGLKRLTRMRLSACYAGSAQVCKLPARRSNRRPVKRK